VCYSDVPAAVVGISAGVSYGALGSTHHSLHDLAALRAIHNISVVVPADNFEARESVRAAAAAEQPVYLRFGKAPLYNLYGERARFRGRHGRGLHRHWRNGGARANCRRTDGGTWS
jgi:transketolase